MPGRDDLSNDDAGRRAIPEVIFSLIDGAVWASWPGKAPQIRLGEYEGVKAMMHDFLDQSALAERLAARNADDR